jgi:hypothetical protein
VLTVSFAVDGSDMLNGDYIREHLYEPTLKIISVEDAAFAPKAVA